MRAQLLPLAQPYPKRIVSTTAHASEAEAALRLASSQERDVQIVP
jgi:hypothetical protein